MARELLFRGCYGPALELMVAFAGEEHGVALRYLSPSTRALLPLSRFPRLRTPEKLRAAPCLEAIIQVATKYPSGGYIAALIIRLIEGGGRQPLSGETPGSGDYETLRDREIRPASLNSSEDSTFRGPADGRTPSPEPAERQGAERRGAERQGAERRGAERQGAERRGVMEFRAPRHDGLELPAEDCFLAEDNEEIEDRNAIRILRWILASHARGSGTNSLAPSALGLPPPTSLLVFAPRYLLILNEGNVRHMLRSPRYRRRILRFVRAGLLYSDSARLSDLLSRSLQRYMMTFDFVQHTRIANRQRNRNVVDTRSSFDPPRAGWESEPRRREGLLPRRGFDHPWLGASVRVPSTDAYGLTSQQVYYVRQHLVYPPPTNLTEIANVAVDFAEIERDAIPLRDG